MSELQVQTRNRSRSKTPFLRSSCDNEQCTHAGEDGHTHHGKVKKSPNVQTIREEVETPNKKEKQPSTPKKVAPKTSDYSSEDPSPDNSLENSQKSSGVATSVGKSSTVKITSSTVITKVQKSSSKSFGGTTSSNTRSSTTSKEGFAHSYASPFTLTNSKETSQNEINTAFEKSHLQTSTPIQVSNIKQTLKGQANGNLEDHIAYKEYKEAGEYWKKYPKTDYTYSKLSPHRRVLAPGVVAMPNMSRSSLDHHDERVNYMIERDPAQEEFIRRRYQATQYAQSQKARDLAYDSQDEVDSNYLNDYSRLYTENRSTYRSESWFRRVVTSVWTTFYNIAGLVSGDNTDQSYLYHTKLAEEKGFFGRIGSRLSSATLTFFQKIYLLISTILFYDTCLLRSSSADNKSKKRFLLILLILFPLLLLAAWRFLDDNERQAYITSAQSLLPLSLISFRNFFTSDWRDIFKLNLSIKPSSQLPLSVTSNIAKSLSSEEYDNILNHVNSYVQQLVDEKLQKERQSEGTNQGPSVITKEISLAIANAVKENVISKSELTGKPYELSDKDVQRIVEIIYSKLSAEPLEGRVSLSKANLDQISLLIHENIEISNNHYNAVDGINIDELLLKVLQSSKLSDFVDGRIITKSNDIDVINRQQLIINELSNEIEFIKSTLHDKLNENEDLRYSIDALQSGQMDLLNRIVRQEESTDGRFDSLLAEIDLKLSTLNEEQFSSINRQIKVSVAEVMGYKDMENIDEIDLQNWVRNMFVAKELLEARLSELNEQTHQALKNEIDRSGMLLMRDISEKIKTEILHVIEVRQKEERVVSGMKTALSEEEVKRIVKSVLSVYDADKTGLVDYALESGGGQIISTRCTENYQKRSAQLSIFGIPLWYPTNTPRIAISPNVHPGECWAFQSFPGFLVVQLNAMVFVSGFTLEHMPKSLSPNGRIDSAPRNFTVWGLDSVKDQNPVFFGEYEYLDNNASLQYFPVQNENVQRPYEFVEMRIETNHGNMQFTCLYRFRVHGKPANS